MTVLIQYGNIVEELFVFLLEYFFPFKIHFFFKELVTSYNIPDSDLLYAGVY